MPARQIRLEDDVWRALERHDQDGSLSARANRALRSFLAGEPRPEPVERTLAPHPARARQIGRCRHPLRARVAGICTLCGRPA